MSEWTQVTRARSKTANAATTSPPSSSSPSSSSSRVGSAVEQRLARQKQKAIDAAKALSSVSATSRAEAGEDIALEERVKHWAHALSQSVFYQELLLALQAKSSDELNSRPFTSLVVLGIGCFSSSKPALLQLALALVLQKKFRDENEEAPSVSCYDPHFSAKEVRVCRSLNMEVPDEDEQPKPEDKHFTAGKRTLFFMPHCPYRLYGDVLWRNWDHLSDVVIIGNSFTSYALRSITPSLPLECDCVRLLQPQTAEHQLWRSSHALPAASSPDGRKESIYHFMETAFNDTSLLTFVDADGSLGRKAIKPTLEALQALPIPEEDT